MIWRWLLAGFGVFLLVLLVALSWLVGTQSGLRTALSLVERAAPDELAVGRATGKLLGPLTLADVRLDLPTVKGQIARAEFDWRPSRLLAGAVQIDLLSVSGVDLELFASEEPEPVAEPFELPESLAAPVDVFVDDVKLNNLQLVSDGTIVEVTRLVAKASWVDTKIDLPVLQLRAPLLDADATALVDALDAYPISLGLKLTARPPDYATVAGVVELSGELKNPQLTLKLAPPYSTTVAATVTALFDAPTLSATLTAEPERLSALSVTLPEAALGLRPKLTLTANGPADDLEAVGQLSVQGDGIPATQTDIKMRLGSTALEIPELTLLIEGQPQPVMLSGDFGFEGKQPLNLRLAWPALSFAMGDDVLSTSKGLLRVNGNLKRYDFSGGTQLGYLGQTNPVELAGSGSATSVVLDTLRLGMGEGELTANAEADWSNGLTADVKLQGQKVNPGVYVSELPGALDLKLSLAVVQTDGGDLTANLKDLKISGELVDLPLRANGRATFAGNTLTAKDIDIGLGDNLMALSGKLGPTSDFDWSLNAADLGQFSDIASMALGGSLVGGGTFKGQAENPQFDAKLTAKNLNIDQQQIDSLDFELNGARRDHQYRLLLESPQADLSLDGGGDLQADNAWRYKLKELLITHPDLDPTGPHHEWSLRSPAGGIISAESVNAQSLCLFHRAPTEGGAICAAAAQQAGGVLRATLGLEELQLQNLNALLPDTMRLEGELAGDLEWAGAIEQTSAALALKGINLLLKEEDDWQAVLRFGPGKVELAPATADNRNMNLNVSLPLDDGLDNTGVFVGAKVTPTANVSSELWPLAARLSMEMPDLSWIAQFTDQLETFSGALKGGLEVNGTISEPTLTGSTLLTAAATEITELGIELRDTRIELKGTSEGLELVGSLRSGEGQLALTGDVAWAQGVRVNSTIKGSDFLVSDSALARATVSPDIKADFADNKLRLRGEVGIPLADIRLAKVPDGAVSASGDQRFVEEAETSAPVDLDALIRVRLGDDVRFTGLGLEASFGGALTVSEKSTGTTTGRGEVIIKEGIYKAYGQDLSVENGKVIFAGGPIDSPGLDIRAVRQATTEVQVGVQVQGSLLEPRLDIFSTPSMPQSDQLSYLILGRPLSSSSASENSLLQQAAMAIGVEGGTLLTDRLGKNLGVDSIGIESEPGTGTAQAALVVGKYLSPRLYVSYGYGLFEPISTLRMEYELSKLWRVVTQSTNEATGGDILWVKER